MRCSGMAQSKTKGIFCLETDWWGVKHRTSVKPALQLLHTYEHLKVPYIHRHIGTREEFFHYIHKWTLKGLQRYPVLYLGFHGTAGHLEVGERRGSKGQVDLDELGELLEGKCKGRVIHFGSCETLDVHGGRLNAFLRRTGAVAVMGYREMTAWIDSTAFEIILLGTLQEWSLTKRGMKALEKRVRGRAPGLAKELGFRLKVAE